MQRLSPPRSRERGATAAIVAVMMVVLVSFAALAVDVGVLWSDQKQLQNGADAAALAVAQSCAGADGCDEAQADTYVPMNKLDGNASVDAISVDEAAGTVFVRSKSTRTLWFAPVLGVASDDLAAEAEATWYTNPGKITTIPLAISYCEFFAKNGISLDDTEAGVGTPVRIDLNPNSGGGGGSGGPAWGDPDLTLDCTLVDKQNGGSGGFGYLDVIPDGSCLAEISVGTVGSKTGNEPCVDGTFTVGDTLVLPLFNNAYGTGGKGYYEITGFAALYVTDLNISGIGNTWIEGDFVKFGTLDEWPTSSTPGEDYGVSAVKLTK